MLIQQQLHAQHGLLNALGRQLAFPDDDDLPTIVVQHLIVLLVSLLVSLDLVHPEFTVRLRNLAA